MRKVLRIDGDRFGDGTRQVQYAFITGGRVANNREGIVLRTLGFTRNRMRMQETAIGRFQCDGLGDSLEVVVRGAIRPSASIQVLARVDYICPGTQDQYGRITWHREQAMGTEPERGGI